VDTFVITVDLSVILNAVIIGLLSLLGWFGKNYLRNINENGEQTVKHLQQLNGRVTRLEVQVTEHGRHDDQRFATIEKMFERE
jgi:hypothetical protein